MEITLFIVQCIGVVSFSITGTMIAIRKGTDMFGALFFALLTSFGGGILRDITVGSIPHLFLYVDYYILAAICIGVSLIVFYLTFIPSVGRFLGKHSHNLLLEVTDALGLSTFCVLGVDTAKEMLGADCVPLLLIYCGFITGVGGGILRDICSAQIPTIFRKNIYLTPAILGSILYTLTSPHWNHLLSMLVSMALIIVIRMLAYGFKWNMPVHKRENESN